MPRRKITKIEWELYIEEHIINKLSLTTICKKYNLNYRTLYCGLKRFNIKPIIAYTTDEERRTNYVDDNYFSNINSEEKAYILGFLIADGCVDLKRNRISLKLKESDKKHLEKILSILSSGYSLHKDKSKINGKTFYSYRLEIKSSVLVADLINLGVIPNKTGKEVLPLLPDDLMPHLIRGIFDGDGSISFYKRKRDNITKVNLYICSTNESFLIDINKYVPGNVYKEPRPGMDMFRLIAGSKEAINTFLTYMYNDATIYLERKFNSYCKYANTVVIPNDKGTP